MMTQNVPANRIRFGPFELDRQTGELRKHGVKLKLQQQPFQILESLLEKPGDLVTREQLRLKLWPDGTFVDYEHGLNAAVQKLRDALNDSSASPLYIETLPKRGYRFVGQVEQQSVETAAPTTDTVQRHTTTPHAVARWAFLALQGMYFIFYIVTLGLFHRLGEGISEAHWLLAGPMPVIFLASAVLGTGLRLFFVMGTLLAFERIRKIFRRIFPLLLVLDLLWALSPLLIEREIGVGLALAAVVALVWSPFAQRTLMHLSEGALPPEEAGKG